MVLFIVPLAALLLLSFGIPGKSVPRSVSSIHQAYARIEGVDRAVDHRQQDAVDTMKVGKSSQVVAFLPRLTP
ncbi:hypothetical protein ABIB90_006409 [Bradyrhizobium sp. JR4.1]